MTRTIKLTDDVLDVLRRSTVQDDILRLPNERLDRRLYAAVDKALQALGGKWNRKAGGHTFADPSALNDALATAIEDGAVAPPSKHGYFPTPPALVDRLLVLADVRPDHRVLEPSAGQGAIADKVREIGAAIDVVELLPANCVVLREKGYRHVGEGDFLRNPPVRIYDCVVMNPPFEGQADIAHVLHAWEFLRPGGRLVSIMATGVTFRQDRKARAFRDFLDTHGGYVETNPPGSFRESGTDVSTVTVVINRVERAG